MCATREIGKQWRIMQINIEGISRSKGEVLSKLLKDHCVDVVMIQETHTDSMESLQNRGKVPGYSIVMAENSNVHGIPTYVRNDILCSVNDVKSTSCNGIYTCTIRVGEMYMTNVYKSPVVQWPDSVLNIFPHPAIYAGDFNSHHQEWCYDDNDSNGELLVDWASRNSFQLVFDAKDEPSFYSQAHQRGYNPDLCFVSTEKEEFPLQVSRSVLCRFPNSQHRPIIYSIGLSIPVIKSIPKPRWNFRKAKWDEYEKNLDDTIRFISPTCENYEKFVKLMINTGKKSIPRGYRKDYIPCWNEESERLHEELQENESPDLAKELLQSLDEARRKR